MGNPQSVLAGDVLRLAAYVPMSTTVGTATHCVKG